MSYLAIARNDNGEKSEPLSLSEGLLWRRGAGVRLHLHSNNLSNFNAAVSIQDRTAFCNFGSFIK